MHIDKYNMVTSVLIQNIYIRIGRYVYIYILPNTQDEVSLTRFIWAAEAGGQREYIGQPRAASGTEAGARTMANMVYTYITVHIITMYSMVDTVLGEISQVVEKQAPLQLTRMFPLQLAIDSMEGANVGLLHSVDLACNSTLQFPLFI